MVLRVLFHVKLLVSQWKRVGGWGSLLFLLFRLVLRLATPAVAPPAPRPATGFRSRDRGCNPSGERNVPRVQRRGLRGRFHVERGVGGVGRDAETLTEAGSCGKQEEEWRTKDPSARAREAATGPIPGLSDGGPNVPCNPPWDPPIVTWALHLGLPRDRIEKICANILSGDIVPVGTQKQRGNVLSPAEDP